jgi:sugar phosphate isomerase/epimerase
MYPSISMWSLDRAIASGSMNQVDFINWAAELELKYVELLSYYMNREDNLNEVKAMLSRCGIEVSAYTILTDFTAPQDFNSEDYINDLDIASKLGAPFVRVLGGDVDQSSRGYSNMIEGLIRGPDIDT